MYYYLSFSTDIQHLFFFNKCFFLFFFLEGEGKRERGTEDPKWAMCWQPRAQRRAQTQELGDSDLSRGQTLNWLNHPTIRHLLRCLKIRFIWEGLILATTENKFKHT